MKKRRLFPAVLMAAMALTMTACEDETPTGSGSGTAPIASTSSTTATTTTFAENQGVNDAVAQITDGLEDPDLEVTKRIKWMGHYDIDETSAGAILFKNTYGIPTEGDDPESEGRIFEYYQVVYAERYDKLGSAIASGNSPDLFPFDAQDYPYGVLRGRYQPIDEIIDLDGAKWQAAKEMMDQYKLNGKYYCAFWDVSINNVMYYRKSMIEEIGAEDPRDLFEAGNWTWDTFLDIARRWQTSGDGRYVIDGYNPENDFVLSTG
ncbi:MAG: extracellular solute-binding protein, partial [Oscillospiraceae bacterium]|nr:extracellular solute-binding protein [Oscillospiraceae bacterium]